MPIWRTCSVCHVGTQLPLLSKTNGSLRRQTQRNLARRCNVVRCNSCNEVFCAYSLPRGLLRRMPPLIRRSTYRRMRLVRKQRLLPMRLRRPQRLRGAATHRIVNRKRKGAKAGDGSFSGTHAAHSESTRLGRRAEAILFPPQLSPFEWYCGEYSEYSRGAHARARRGPMVCASQDNASRIVHDGRDR